MLTEEFLISYFDPQKWYELRLRRQALYNQMT